ncbi:MAG: DedA family protein [Planctomycetia bacterium]|jgi:membrane protein DedA with SNARE-associated domain|nr:DedA family protein [Planctomycetia bacterium]MCC7316010.1 DedA family protein [Planctomycetota bacterium]OQZ06419.1 MAG: hypothetical protein B6D36_05090 [Planctomycetes bacterium UTPLA1]
MSIEALFQTYGYPALFVGTFLEGETILILAGFAAHRAYLNIYGVVIVAFLGSMAGDQFWFYLGRRHGRGYIAMRPQWQPKADRVLQLLKDHQIPILLTFRFLYGLRNVTPFVIGASGFSPLRFSALNAFGAAVWAAAFGAAGYHFGNALEAILEDVRHYELAVFAAISLVGFLFWTRRRLSLRTPVQPPRDSRSSTKD